MDRRTRGPARARSDSGHMVLPRPDRAAPARRLREPRWLRRRILRAPRGSRTGTNGRASPARTIYRRGSPGPLRPDRGRGGSHRRTPDLGGCDQDPEPESLLEPVRNDIPGPRRLPARHRGGYALRVTPTTNGISLIIAVLPRERTPGCGRGRGNRRRRTRARPSRLTA